MDKIYIEYVEVTISLREINDNVLYMAKKVMLNDLFTKIGVFIMIMYVFREIVTIVTEIHSFKQVFAKTCLALYSTQSWTWLNWLNLTRVEIF